MLLDYQNPRFPVEYQRPELSQDELCLFIDKRYDPLQIARSIARHGYFESEPLIAIQDETKDAYVIVEGNRRLTALKALSSSSLREKLATQTKAWRSLPSDVSLPDDFPVIVVKDRFSIVPLLGFRHISGIEPWEPFAQARFIASLVDQGSSLEEIAGLVGRGLTEVRSMYRDHEILRQATEQFEIDTTRAEESFGVFSAAMGRTKIRNYIKAPDPRDVDTEYWPLPEESAPKLDRLLTYVFGKEEGEGRVIHDSRQLQGLGDILADPSGEAESILDETKDVDLALQGLRGNQQFLGYIRSAERAINSAVGVGATSIDDVTRQRLIAIRNASESLLELPCSDLAEGVADGT